MPIPQMFVGGAVPRDAVGRVLEVLFEFGATKMDIAPVIESMRPPKNGHAFAPVRNKNQKLLAGPTEERKHRSSAKYVETATFALVNIFRITKKPRMHNKEIGEAFDLLGRSGKSVGNAIFVAQKSGHLKKAGVGHSALGPKAKSVPPQSYPELKALGAGDGKNKPDIADIPARADKSNGNKGQGGRMRDVLRVLRSANSPLRPEQIAGNLGISPKKTYGPLRRLVEEKLAVEAGNSTYKIASQ